MKFWFNRYTIPGWVLTLTLLLLLRYFPLPVPDNSQLKDVWSAGIAVIALVAGMPLGYLVYAVVEFVYRTILHGTGRFVDQSSLREGLQDIFSALATIEDPPLSRRYIARMRRVLNNREAFPDRALYTYVWRTFAPREFRNGCHQRWESFHVSWGVICGLLISILTSAIAAYLTSTWTTYLSLNGVILLVSALMIGLLARNSHVLAHQAARQENLWVHIFLAEIEEAPHNFAIPPLDQSGTLANDDQDG